MSKKVRVTPEIIQAVKEIYDNHPERWHWEIGHRVGVCDETVRRILNNEYRIEGDKVVRIYKHSDPKSEQNLLHMYPDTKSAAFKQLLNSLYGSKAFSTTLKDICDELKQIRELLTDLSNTLK